MSERQLPLDLNEIVSLIDELPADRFRETSLGKTEYFSTGLEATPLSPAHFAEKIGEELGMPILEAIKFLEKFGFDDLSYWFIFQIAGKSGFFARQCASLDEGASMENASATLFYETGNDNEAYQMHVAGAEKGEKVINSASYKTTGDGNFKLEDFDVILDQKDVPKHLVEYQREAETSPYSPSNCFSSYLTAKMSDKIGLVDAKRLYFYSPGPGDLKTNIVLFGPKNSMCIEQNVGFTYTEKVNSATVKFGDIHRTLPLRIKKH